MKKVASFIKSIKQCDNFTFEILWNDDTKYQYRLSDLQKICPCAGCQEKKSVEVKEDVRAVRIVNVGRYALRIEFTSGCSAGIYDYDLLKALSNASEPLISSNPSVNYE